MRYLLLSVLVVCMIGIMVPSALASSEVEFGHWKHPAKYDSRYYQGLPPENVGKLGDEHVHASILVIINNPESNHNGLPTNLSPLASDSYGTEWIFFVENETSQYGNTIHRYVSGVDLQFLFNSYHITFDDKCWERNAALHCTDGWWQDHSLKFFINREQVNDISKYVIQDGDKILVSFGDEHTDWGDPIKQLDLLDQHVILSSSSHDAMVSEKLKFWENKQAGITFQEIKNQALSSVVLHMNSDEVKELINFDKLKQFSPEAFQSLRPEHVDITSPNFCGAVDSPNLTTEEKQVFLDFCKNIVLWFKDEVRNSLTEVDKAVIITETKINAMNISDEQKINFIVELRSEAKKAKQASIDVSTKYIPRAENIVNEHSGIQKIRLELAGAMELEPLYIVIGVVAIGGIIGAIAVAKRGSKTPKPAKQELGEYEEQYLTKQKPAKQKPAKKKETSAFCENCGNTLNPKAKFCGSCGTPVS